LNYKSLAWSLYGLSLASAAQNVPGAGVFQQQIDKERRVELPKVQSNTTLASSAPAPLQVQGELVIEVREFRFAGNKRIDNSKLAKAVASYVDRPLDWAQLQAVTTAVAQTYRDRGWVVRAYLPEQDIEQGVVTIQVVEAVFGGIQFDAADQPRRIAKEKIQAVFDAQIQPGDTLAQQQLERALLVSDDLPGVAVAGALSEGDASGQTRMKIKLTDEPFTSGDLTLDNTGSRSTGRNRAVANLQLSSPAGIGDQLSVLGLFTDGTRYSRAAYIVPLGANGWRIGANGSYLGYKVITHDVPDDLRGTSTVLGLEASYPLLRTRMNNLYLSLSADHKGFNNKRNQETSTQYNSNVYSVGLNGNGFDNFAGGGANSAGVTISAGRVNNQIQAEAMQGQFSKLRYQLRRQQVVANSLSLTTMFSGQWANRTLDSSEKFYLGGASGVRAYPSSEGGGSLGQMINLDLRQQLSNGLNAGVFYDWGRFKDPAGGPIPQALDIKGWGLALGWQADSGLSLRTTWARRIGNNPNPTASGNDQDGTLMRDRYWMTATLPF
jgi:hemolysin activation/secretion protein